MIVCLSCGSSTKYPYPGLPNLCASCAKAIPWILQPRCLVCGRGMGCPDCTRQYMEQRPFQLNRSAVMYDERMREWLGQYKYRGKESLEAVLGPMVVKAYDSLIQEMRYTTGDRRWKADIITFVPVSPSRLQERGFNQAEKLAASVARQAKLPAISLLQRTRDTEKQSLKSRSERLKDMRSAFVKRPEGVLEMAKWFTKVSSAAPNQPNPAEYSRCPKHLPAVNIILVDDIYTTGSTIGACAAELKIIATELGREASVYSLTWARA